MLIVHETVLVKPALVLTINWNVSDLEVAVCTITVRHATLVSDPIHPLYVKYPLEDDVSEKTY